jgi:hypothetical protein
MIKLRANNQIALALGLNGVLALGLNRVPLATASAIYEKEEVPLEEMEWR